MTWQALFERASGHDVTVTEVREALAAHREDDD